MSGTIHNFPGSEPGQPEPQPSVAPILPIEGHIVAAALAAEKMKQLVQQVLLVLQLSRPNALRQGPIKLDAGLAKKIGEMLASDDVKQLQRLTGIATKSPAVLRLLDAIGDEAGKLAGMSPGPLEVTVRPRGVPAYMPAAANDEQQ